LKQYHYLIDYPVTFSSSEVDDDYYKDTGENALSQIYLLSGEHYLISGKKEDVSIFSKAH
jgi:hypothetical protein